MPSVETIFSQVRKIDNTRTTFALEQINQDLKVCLPLLPLNEQLNLPVGIYFIKVGNLDKKIVVNN